MNDPRETLNRIRKQADNATEGPWRHISIFEVGGFVENPHGRELFDWAQDDAGTICAPDPDAEFIAHARTTVPALLDALEKVLELHPRVVVLHADPEFGRMEDDAICGACIVNHEAADWPCPNVRAITTALDGIR